LRFAGEDTCSSQLSGSKNGQGSSILLGLASFYRRLISNFAEIAKPLTKLTRKDENIEWDAQQQSVYDEMENKLCTIPVLAYPKFQLPFIFTTHASETAVAAILSQVQKGVKQPISFGSRQLSKAERAHSASDLEMVALELATKHFLCYLHG
jgi:hypothetical protein